MKAWKFSDDVKFLKSNEPEGVSVFTFYTNLEYRLRILFITWKPLQCKLLKIMDKSL